MAAIPRPFTILGHPPAATPVMNGFTSTGTGVFTSAATSGLQLYNTADRTTNYERLEALWSGDVGILGTNAGGSGTRRDLTLRAGSSGTTFTTLTLRRLGSPSLQFVDAGDSAGNNVQFSRTSTLTSGTMVAFAITPTYNQASGTAANTDFLINRTETAVGSGTQLLADLQVGGSSRFKVSNAGAVTATSNIQTSGALIAGAADSVAWNGRAIIRSSADGILRLANNTDTDFSRLQLGGMSASFPALKRSSTAIAVRLADDSADAPITAAGITGSAGFNLTAVSTKTGAYTVTANDYFIRGDATSAGFTVTLPAATSITGRTYVIKKIDSTGNVVTVNGGGTNIDGAATQSLDVQYESFTLISNGTTWDIASIS